MPLFCGDIVNIPITLIIVKYVSYYIEIKNYNYISISIVILIIVILMMIYDILLYSNFFSKKYKSKLILNVYVTINFKPYRHY